MGERTVDVNKITIVLKNLCSVVDQGRFDLNTQGAQALVRVRGEAAQLIAELEKQAAESETGE